MAGSNSRTLEEVRRDIESEREQLAGAAETLRGEIGEAKAPRVDGCARVVVRSAVLQSDRVGGLVGGIDVGASAGDDTRRR